MCDILDHMVRSGFRQIVIVNGHGGNGPAHGAILEWLDRNRGVQVKWHNWWNAPDHGQGHADRHARRGYEN
jgi:creatinine amidohydrolase